MKNKLANIQNISEIVAKNKMIDVKVIENINKLREQAKLFGFEQNSSYRITPPLGSQILFFRKK